MWLKIGLLGVLIVAFFRVTGQKDSLVFHGFGSARGMFQTGNLEQYGGNAIAKLSLENSKWYGGVSMSYNHVTVHRNNIINDAWSYLVLKRSPLKSFYPLTMVYSGFAKSFGIKRAIVTGIGGGWNIIRKAPKKFLELNIIGGYGDFNYRQTTAVKEALINVFVLGNTTLIKDKINGRLEFHGYYAPWNNTFFGFQQEVVLAFPIYKSWSITASHLMIYSQTVDVGKMQMNTMSLLGIQFKR